MSYRWVVEKTIVQRKNIFVRVRKATYKWKFGYIVLQRHRALVPTTARNNILLVYVCVTVRSFVMIKCLFAYINLIHTSKTLKC